MKWPAYKRNGWGRRHLVAAVLMVGACVFIAGNAWADLLTIGLKDEESSHILLVPFVVVWLAWVRRGRFRNCQLNGRWVGTVCIGVGWLLWSLGYRGHVQSFWHAGAVLMAVGGLLTVVGRDVFVKYLPVFAVLVFLIPVPATARRYIAAPLQATTAKATQDVAEVLGMMVAREGSLLSINGTQVAIAEACNGIRMVFTLFLACYVFSFVTPLRGYVRVIILGASPLIAIVANVTRLVPTVWMFGHATDSVAEWFHTISGWVMLVAAFLALTGIVKVLRWASIPVEQFTLAAT